MGDEVYIPRRSPLETLHSLRLTATSTDDMFKELEKTELRFVAKYAEILDMRRLFIELERRNLLEKWLPHHTSLT